MIDKKSKVIIVGGSSRIGLNLFFDWHDLTLSNVLTKNYLSQDICAISADTISSS